MKQYYRETELYDGTIISEKQEYSWVAENPSVEDLNTSVQLQKEFIEVKGENGNKHIIRLSEIKNIRIFSQDEPEEENNSENVEEAEESYGNPF